MFGRALGSAAAEMESFGVFVKILFASAGEDLEMYVCTKRGFRFGEGASGD